MKLHPLDIAKVERAKHLAEMACDRSLGHSCGVQHYLLAISDLLMSIIPSIQNFGDPQAHTQSDKLPQIDTVIGDLFSGGRSLLDDIQGRHKKYSQNNSKCGNIHANFTQNGR